jgi:hypothetical protein
MLRDQQVVGEAKATGGEQVGPVTVVGERPGFPHQPVDDVPVLDAMLALAPQPWQPFDAVLGVPDLDVLGAEAGLDPLADQPAGHRVGVAGDVDGTALVHPYLPSLTRLQATVR